MAVLKQSPNASVVVLRNVDWATYSALRDDDANRHVRMTYDRGALILMSPGRLHERIGELLARMIFAWTEERNVSMLSAGSTTMRNKLLERGFEPDKSFYIQNEEHARDSDDYDAETDLPPDLTIEVDVSRISMARMPIVAQFGVPEVWRWHEEQIMIYRLIDHYYTKVESSIALAGFPFAKALDLIARRHELSETRLIAEFRRACGD